MATTIVIVVAVGVGVVVVGSMMVLLGGVVERGDGEVAGRGKQDGGGWAGCLRHPANRLHCTLIHVVRMRKARIEVNAHPKFPDKDTLLVLLKMSGISVGYVFRNSALSVPSTLF